MIEPVDYDACMGDDLTSVNFSEASLYLVALQTVLCVCLISTTSVLSCWLLAFDQTASSVRTLALCTIVGSLMMRHPLRFGRPRGLKVIFAALQPAVPIYLMSLIVEQLAHTCVVDNSTPSPWRQVLFHLSVVVMALSGLMRSWNPLSESDIQFLFALLALLVVSIVPPSSVTHDGPLCFVPTLWSGAERIYRAFVFSTSYATHVYALTDSQKHIEFSEQACVVGRALSATVWTLCASPSWLIASVVQMCLLVYARLGRTDKSQKTTRPYVSVWSDESDTETLALKAIPRPHDVTEDDMTQSIERSETKECEHSFNPDTIYRMWCELSHLTLQN